MPSRAFLDENSADARALRLLLGDGDDALGALRLAQWHALRFLPAVPAGVRTGYALWRPERGWTRCAGALTARLLLGHFRGEWALGGVYAGEAACVVHDLDNRAGKAAGDAAACDDDLDARAALIRRAQPRAVWLRSSASGGLHAWTFLDEPHPVRALVHLAHARLLAAAADVPALRDALERVGVRGLPGLLELLPQVGGDQGSVIRAPLGPKSVLLDDALRPLELSPGAAIARLAAWARGRRLSLRDAFLGPLAPWPRDDRGGGPPPGVASGGVVPSVVRHQPNDWRALLERCDGRLPAALRARPAEFRRLARRLWTHGLPGPSTRHLATFALALICRWERVSEDAAADRLVAWFRVRGGTHSREWRTRPALAERKTRSIVRHVYRPEAPQPQRRPRHRAPGLVSLEDQARLMRLLPHDPLGVDVALAILRWVRTNAYVLAPERVVCEIPMRALGITTRRRRAAWQRVHATGAVFRLYGARVSPRSLDHPAGPRRARAARYTILWRFAEYGPRIRGREVLSARRRGYLAARPTLPSASASTVGRPLSGTAGVLQPEPVVGRVVVAEDRHAGVGPVGAVRAPAVVGGRMQAAVGNAQRFPRGCGRTARVSYFEGPSTAPSAASASTGRWGGGGSTGSVRFLGSAAALPAERCPPSTTACAAMVCGWSQPKSLIRASRTVRSRSLARTCWPRARSVVASEAWAFRVHGCMGPKIRVRALTTCSSNWWAASRSPTTRNVAARSP